MEYLQVHLCGLPWQFSGLCGLSGLWVKRSLAPCCGQGETVTPDSKQWRTSSSFHLSILLLHFRGFSASWVSGRPWQPGMLKEPKNYTVFDLSVFRCCVWGHCGSGFKTACETNKGRIRRGCCSTCTPSSSSSCQVRATCADSPGLQQTWNRRISYSIDK